ncbi:hypothetical protein BDZ89DRAFT_1070087 [Hymenopellis radicata]|nr:hypothetical protein BDZ89DRAFT_1070087 [Hymenopellis radicata]
MPPPSATSVEAGDVKTMAVHWAALPLGFALDFHWTRPRLAAGLLQRTRPEWAGKCNASIFTPPS